MTGDEYVMELAIYSRPRAAFHAKRARDEKQFLDREATRHVGGKLTPTSESGLKDLYRKIYPDAWHFNDAIGFIRVFALWDQIRGDLYYPISLLGDGRRYDPRTRKVYEMIGKAFEMSVPRDYGNDDLTREIRKHLIGVGEDLRRKGAHVDTEAFDNIAPHVDWLGLLASVGRPALDRRAKPGS